MLLLIVGDYIIIDRFLRLCLYLLVGCGKPVQYKQIKPFEYIIYTVISKGLQWSILCFYVI